MLSKEYSEFVIGSDQSLSDDMAQLSPADLMSRRMDIAMYGLVGELGSVLSAVKKRLLAEDGRLMLLQPNDEIGEELGDVLWYAFLLDQLLEDEGGVGNILQENIAALLVEVDEQDAQGEAFRRAIGADNHRQFVHEGGRFCAEDCVTFGDYQRVAFLTARTSGETLLTVCLSVLWQLGAELLRSKLPPIEQELNQTLPSREPRIVLGEILWHVAAVASLYGRSLDSIAVENRDKISFRQDRSYRTPLHDEDAPPEQQFPRRFEIAFVTIGKGRSRMYFQGKQLGDELTDNAYSDDGYRFHDVMHLANAAILGWSPVLRSLMERKRKFDPRKDEVEDGARARIVEEAVIKAIHSEGLRLAANRHGPIDPDEEPRPLFRDASDLTFQFLKFVHNFTDGLEVFRNRYGEWERAIVEGHTIFQSLRIHQQGTVVVDLDERRLDFRPEVSIDLKGVIGGMGSALVDAAELGHRVDAGQVVPELPAGPLSLAVFSQPHLARQVACRRAVAEALGVAPAVADYSEIVVNIEEAHAGIHLDGNMRRVSWERGVITFRISFAESGNLVSCQAIAVCDPKST
ncbi:MazG nucleotide pyrophosphohydrolase domain-containing protein [Sphingopyxis alaskensis]|uniref:MazG nucleotide pyrophosphohydrolase domain-containing protein n=1 Tax=Sphingopyxis alaskensis TaxID=117207 RepID=UPI00391CE6B5